MTIIVPILQCVSP